MIPPTPEAVKDNFRLGLKLYEMGLVKAPAMTAWLLWGGYEAQEWINSTYAI